MNAKLKNYLTNAESVIEISNASEASLWLGKVDVIAYHGLDLLLHIKTDATDTPIIARMTADVMEVHKPIEGQQITVSWSAKNTHILPT